MPRRSTAERIAARHGGIDIVISNAAARISPDLDNAAQVRGFVDTNNHGTRRMLDAFLPLLRDGARYVVVASWPPCPPEPPTPTANWCNTAR
ncbi:hypothetical protein [Nocardia amikacinitolerans]|uniref:hypothetical protein n=1 Tax=Nocardia amikacinitolerans TaxID=756689 RepID=UPI000BE414E2|nr:hypothetical protein [Nocardia amikacinitolerans]MCP2279594.1 hypothetical protein [Nocardia amikacinitolerans]MCP2298608.1 hypothetical protein [Nocardia amikacinitolerans]